MASDKMKDLFGSLAGAKPGSNSLKNKLDRLIKNRPQYDIKDEVYENQALAKNQAFGRDRSSQIAEQNINTGMADSVGQAQQVSGSSNAILDTIAQINYGANNSLRDLAEQEAQIQSGRMNDLYGANNAVIDEQDKAWNFNVNEPYQNQIQALRDRKKFRQEALFKALDTVGAIGAGIAGKKG